jgi:glucose/mannose-6-phosphate isomerase
MVRTKDWAKLRSGHDPSGMYDLIYNFPDQLRRAVEIAVDVDLSSLSTEGINSICVAGLGGSAIGGDLARSYLQYDLSVPMAIIRHYELPAWVGRDTLVFVSSYSGNTEETLSAAAQARDRGCQAVALTSGGRVAETARASSWPVVSIPPGMPPRAALAFSFVPVLVALGRLGLVDDRAERIEALADFLEGRRARFAFDAPPSANTATSLAVDMLETVPIVYAGADYQDAVAVRFKGQICENAKQLAFANVFPEFNHNELVGYKVLDAYRDRLFVVILRDEDDHTRVARRMDIVEKIIDAEGVRVVSLSADGSDVLQRMFSHVQLGDFASYYLALANGVDPTPVKVIDQLKGELAREGSA